MSKQVKDKQDSDTATEDPTMTADQQDQAQTAVAVDEEALAELAVKAVKERMYFATETELRRMLQAEADREARLLRTNEAPEGGKYLIPIMSPSDSLIGYEWRDGNGNPVDPPSDWQE
ncbi:MAG: hypothetical protein M3Q03_06415 [Chloroflexota bacterium]|nr:hypothetical protein [Chloroflexota bacterium]